MLPFKIALAVIVLLLSAQSAHAICNYRGEFDVQTTFEQEFADSTWVVRAEVVASESWFPDAESEALPWVIYRLRVIEDFKGSAPQEMTFFTQRHSGAFYMERPYEGPNIGGQYLLFLNPVEPNSDDPPEAVGTVFVNYNCGQSRRWTEVSAEERDQLARMRS